MPDTSERPTTETKPIGYSLGAHHRVTRGSAARREKVIRALRKLAWVAPLTLLIWIYAERQQERRQTVQFRVGLDINSPDRTIGGEVNRLVTAELRGPAAQLDNVRTMLLQTGDKPAVTITLDQSVTPGPYEVRTSQIASDSLFSSHAITVESTEPQTLTVYVDRVVDRDVPVQAPPSITNLDGKPVFDPPQVRFRGPKQELDRAESEGLLVAYADLAGRESLRTPGIHDEKAVPVSSPIRAEHVTFSPTKVNVTLKVRPADVTYTWPYMPVWVNMPPGFADKYRVVLTNQTLKDVKLVGPAETIAAMQQENFRPKPKARLDLSNADLPAGETRVKTVQFDDLPRGVSVSSEDQQRTVEFRLVETGRE